MKFFPRRTTHGKKTRRIFLPALFFPQNFSRKIFPALFSVNQLKNFFCKTLNTIKSL